MALILTLLMVRFFSNHLRPVVETVAVSEATNFISVTVAEVVEQCMQEQGLGYDDLMEIHQAQEDGIRSFTPWWTVWSTWMLVSWAYPWATSPGGCCFPALGPSCGSPLTP